MRKLLILLVGFAMVIGAAAPALAATCGDLFAVARLHASGSGTAEGRALVFFGGTVEVVEIDSAIVGSVVEQAWHFDQGDVNVTESPNPQYLPGPWQLIDSSVVVEAPDGGEWTFDGIYNEVTMNANFIVSGELCLS